MENFIINQIPEFVLPGFRFHPTEEELVDYYLKKTAVGKNLHSDIIGFLNIYQYNPWDLPGMAKIGEREWYFFVRRDKKGGHGGKPNRTTETGYWKATGSDRHIRCLKEPKKIVGVRKILVFYIGKAPKGSRTDWVMNEYRLSKTSLIPTATEDVVLCKIYRKATSLRELDERAEEQANIGSSDHHHQHELASYVDNDIDVPLSVSPATLSDERSEEQANIGSSDHHHQHELSSYVDYDINVPLSVSPATLSDHHHGLSSYVDTLSDHHHGLSSYVDALSDHHHDGLFSYVDSLSDHHHGLSSYVDNDIDAVSRATLSGPPIGPWLDNDV